VLSSDEFLTVAEVAELLKLNQQTVRNWIDRGYLPALHVGRRVRIRRSDLEQLLEESRIQPPAESSCAAQAFWEGEPPPDPVPPTGSQ
jgi:excisionase family DNA binding protein